MTDFRPRRFDLIVFDWDGTLFDSTALIVRCIQAACADVGTTVPSDAQAAYVIGLGLHDALAHAAPDLPKERVIDLAQRYRHHYFAAQHELTLFPGTLEMLGELKSRHHWLGVATGKSRRGLDEALDRALDARESGLSLRRFFDATRTADETASKPNPLMLNELMREFGVAPERTLMIGDTTHDLLLADNAGAASLAVSYGAHEVEAFDAHAPVFVAHSTRELHDWLIAHA
ncbi:HAD family hydrolase [Caldimonas sp. KR1-144]|uniref:HAD family hydrolase n=1 Tax=Caldimonas sp. KR1-144 TaxID=3400911 RepID=UPI003BFF0A22